MWIVLSRNHSTRKAVKFPRRKNLKDRVSDAWKYASVHNITYYSNRCFNDLPVITSSFINFFLMNNLWVKRIDRDERCPSLQTLNLCLFEIEAVSPNLDLRKRVSRVIISWCLWWVMKFVVLSTRWLLRWSLTTVVSVSTDIIDNEP